MGERLPERTTAGLACSGEGAIDAVVAGEPPGHRNDGNGKR